MALLNINWHGADFERGMAILRDSLDAVTAALEANRTDTQKRWDDYEQAVENGAPREEVWEDEVKVWDRSFAYQEDILMIVETGDMMRKIHVIALYHLWERIAGAWTKASSKADHKKLVRLVEAKGIAVHPRMDAIRDLNNALKHNSETYGPALLKSWPELFTPRFRDTIEERRKKISANPSASRIDWHEAISISPGRMDEIFDAVRQSGPVGGPEK